MSRGLTDAEHARRRDAVTAAAEAGQTITEVAADLGLSTTTTREWLRRHMPLHGLRHGASLTADEEERRTRAVREGRAAGLTWGEIADGLGMHQKTLRTWRYAKRPTPPPPPPASTAVDLWATVTVGAGCWLVTCGPCARRFTRPDRRRAEWLAAMHARMHGLTITARDRTGTRYEAADVAVA